MIEDIINQFTTLNDWKYLREAIKEKILYTLGDPPSLIEGVQNEYKEVDKYERKGFEHIKIRYHVAGNEWTDAIYVLPKAFNKEKKYPVIMAIHGSNMEGKYSLMKPEERPNRNYVYELAQRGYIVFSPDQFSYGEALGTDKNEEFRRKIIYEFHEKYPDWSLDGLHLWSHRAAVNVMEQLDNFDTSKIGSIGNSRGGRAVIHLAAFDPRMKASVCSTGVSPNFSSVRYHMNDFARIKCPRLYDEIKKNGNPPWDYHHLVALCAPNALLVLEPFNDPYNHNTMASMQCVHKGAAVYKLVGCDENLQLLVHGHGHDTRDEIRQYAYKWLDIQLM